MLMFTGKIKRFNQRIALTIEPITDTVHIVFIKTISIWKMSIAFSRLFCAYLLFRLRNYPFEQCTSTCHQRLYWIAMRRTLMTRTYRVYSCAFCLCIQSFWHFANQCCCDNMEIPIKRTWDRRQFALRQHKWLTALEKTNCCLIRLPYALCHYREKYCNDDISHREHSVSLEKTILLHKKQGALNYQRNNKTRKK